MLMKIGIIIAAIVCGSALVYSVLILPLHLTYLNTKQLIKDLPDTRKQSVLEILTLLIGGFYTFVYMGLDLVFIRLHEDWDFIIPGIGYHSPILEEAQLTIFACVLVGLSGFFLSKLLRQGEGKRGLRIVAIGMMGVGVLVSSLWILQIIRHSFVLIVLPLNMIVMTVNEIRKQGRVVFPKTERMIPQILVSGATTLLAMVFILMIWGQRPDNIIRAWTQTADWTLSMKTKTSE